MDCAHCSVPVVTLPSPPLPRVPVHRYCASLWRVRLAQRCGSLDLCACRGRLVGGGHERCQRRACGGRLRRGASPLLVGHVHKADGERAAGKSWPKWGRRGVRVVCVRAVGMLTSGRKTDDGRKCQLPSQSDGLCCFHLACIAIFSKSPGGLSESHTGDLKDQDACGNFRISDGSSQSQLKL